MPYLLAILSVGFVLGLQYFLSMWLIKIGWFYVYAQPMGGFVLLIFLGISILIPIFKRRIPKNDPSHSPRQKAQIDEERIRIGNQQDNAVRWCAVLILVGSFWLNIKIGAFQEPYEYQHFGIQTKAIITQKYTLQNKNRSYVFVLQTQEKPQPKELKYRVSASEYANKNVGDTLSIIYSPRYQGSIKIQ